MSTSEPKERLQCRMRYVRTYMGFRSDTPFCVKDILCTHVCTYVCVCMRINIRTYVLYVLGQAT